MVYALNTGLTVTAPDGRGVAVCPIDSPLVSIDERGIWKYSPDFIPKRPMVYVNLFNNQWSTNFQQWISGTLSCRVRLWPVSGPTPEQSLVTTAMEARVPCQVAAFKGRPGPLPLARSGLSLSRPGILVTAFGPNPDGDNLLLRLWEQIGNDQPCRVQLPEGLRVTRVQPCDLRGRQAGSPILVTNGSFEVPMTRFAPVSLMLTKGS